MSLKVGDVLGLAADLSTGELQFGCNGEWSPAPFGRLPEGAELCPAVSMTLSALKLNLGGPFRYAGPTESYEAILPGWSLADVVVLHGKPDSVIVEWDCGLERDDHCDTPFYRAAREGLVSELREFIKRGIDVNSKQHTNDAFVQYTHLYQMSIVHPT